MHSSARPLSDNHFGNWNGKIAQIATVTAARDLWQGADPVEPLIPSTHDITFEFEYAMEWILQKGSK